MDSSDSSGDRTDRPADARADDARFLESLFDELFPLCRSITGPGIRHSLAILGRHMPLALEEVASGTEVFDWTVPQEWILRRARLTAPDGTVVADSDVSNLHVVSYSEPVDRQLSLEQLRPHLHSTAALPQAVPYVTSYYRRTWGFCLPHATLQGLPAGDYHALIDSEFVAGHVVLGSCVLPGESPREVLLSSYLCHPSLANNELSGPLVLLGLYRRLAAWPRRRFTYRFLLNPETIGSLCYLWLHGGALKQRMVAGLVLTCLGGPSPTLSYKQSRRGDSLLDQTVQYLRAEESAAIQQRPFDPTSGSDERQYGSPGFNLPVGQMARTVYDTYPGYHNSLDTKEFMGIGPLVASVDAIESLLATLELAGIFRNLAPYGEPQLGKRGLYPHLNSPNTRRHSTDVNVDGRTELSRILTILNYADGETLMLDVARRCHCPLEELRPTIERLEAAGLLRHEGLAAEGAGP